MNNSVCGESSASSGSIVMDDDASDGGGGRSLFPGPTRWSSPRSGGGTAGPVLFNSPHHHHGQSPTSRHPGASGLRRTLKLTACAEGAQFTCDDGACVDMGGRCDRKADCADYSDEFDCRLIALNRGHYVKERRERCCVCTSNVL